MKEKEEESSCSGIMDGVITGIKFGLASRDEIVSKLSCSVYHAQLLDLYACVSQCI